MANKETHGSCLCGKCTFSYTGDPMRKAVCHCNDCRKMSGSVCTTNLWVPPQAFKLISGTPKEYVMKSDSGNTITNFFCAECGVTLWRESSAFPVKGIREGVMNEISDSVPDAEYYSERRVGWMSAIPKTASKESAGEAAPSAE